MNARQLLFETPTMDLFRRRSGRLNWRRRLRDSGLPVEVQQIVRRIAGQWRLTRRERAAVADELIAHFADGGTLADFGDVSAARKLFRRATIRKRGVWWPAVQGVALAVVLLLGYYGFLAARFALGTPALERDFIAELTRQYGPPVPLEDATPAALSPQSDWWDAWAAAEEERHHLGDAAPWLTAAETSFFRTHSEMLDELRDLADRPFSWSLPAEREATDTAELPLMAVLLPQLNNGRLQAVLLRMDTRAAVEDGDAERVLANLRALAQIAEQITSFPTLVNMLVAKGIDELLFETVAESVRREPALLNDAQLRDVAHLVAGRSVAPDLRFERWSTLDLLQRSYTAGDDGRLTPDALQVFAHYGTVEDALIDPGASAADGVAQVAAAWHDLLHAPTRGEMRRRFEAFYDRAEADLARPMWEPIEPEAGAEADDKRIAAAMLAMVPAIDRLRLTVAHHAAQRDGVLVGLALEAHHRDHGGYPATLDELVPAYLPTRPTDPFNGEPLRYVLTNDGPLLYSVGTDGDDDGGRMALDRLGKPTRWQAFDLVRTDGDAPLWP